MVWWRSVAVGETVAMRTVRWPASVKHPRSTRVSTLLAAGAGRGGGGEWSETTGLWHGSQVSQGSFITEGQLAVDVDGRESGTRVRTWQTTCGVFNRLPENTTLCHVESNHHVPPSHASPWARKGMCTGGAGPCPCAAARTSHRSSTTPPHHSRG